ncbi:MAG: hypothetical protein ILP19_01915, partial [Oscillospiraceae bacterium]|nr:hypothetical protein [Oscillospiraceae bacterium]
ADNMTESHVFYAPISQANKVMTKSLFDVMRISLKTAEDDPFNNMTDMYQGVKNNKYVGEITENKNVVILTSHHTGSAADTFVHDMRKNGLAYVIGNNTGGEGLNYSFVESKLPNSNIAFIYNPGGSYTFENEDNSVYGTRPDYYLDTAESFIRYLENNTPNGFDELCANDEAIRYAYEYLTK